MEFCQSQRSRFDLLEAAPIQMDRSDAEGVKDGDADTGKNQVLSFLGYNLSLFIAFSSMIRGMEDDKKTIAVNFKKELKEFTTKVQELTQNAELSSRKEFLEKVADDVNSLYASSIQVQKAEDQEIEEIGSIIQNIFIQPLSSCDGHKVTLLKAVEAFKKGEGDESDLSNIMKEYVNHPETTKSFLRELELLGKDLDAILKKSA
ncbi:MAG: hypothetical protein KDK60_00915 [Chlamydiia bacterium]|nr:hypothetical protein [Chlamydiia bacterium]